MMFAAIGPVGIAQAQEVIEYYGTDHLSSVRVVFSVGGTLVARADYLPFGEEVSAPTGPLPAEQFTGQARDGEAGQDYFHARTYQPRTGRFSAVDPLFVSSLDPQQWNRYSYARNNSNKFVDPSGMVTQTIKVPDTNCRQSQGAYWCPGSLFIPDPFNPGTVDQIFDGDRQGYQGGETNAFTEQIWGVNLDGGFFSMSDLGKGVLGGGEASNKTDRNLLSKDEKGDTASVLAPGQTLASDGVYDARSPGQVFLISDGMRAVFLADGSVRVGLTGRAQLFAMVPGAVPFYLDRGQGKNRWVPLGPFVDEHREWATFAAHNWPVTPGR